MKLFLLTLKNFWQDRVPLSASGSLLMIGSLALVGVSIPQNNPYGVSLGTLGLFSLAFLLLLGVLQKNGVQNGEIRWALGQKLRSALRTKGLNLSWKGKESWPLFRLRYGLSGRLSTTKGPLLSFSLHGILHQDQDSPVALSCPFSGELSCELRAFLGDVFGLTRWLIHPASQRTLTILPQPIGLGREAEKVISQGEESLWKFKEAEEERYLMREYAPGDRVRDINWKSSFRTGQLITRISPERKDQSLELHLVLGLNPGARSYPALAEQEVLKGWIAGFLIGLFREPGVQKIHLYHGPQLWTLSSQEEVEAFHYQLAILETSNDPCELPLEVSPVLYFGTGYDKTFRTLHKENPQRTILLWQTEPGKEGGVMVPQFWIPPTGHFPTRAILSQSRAQGTGVNHPNVTKVSTMPIDFSGDPMEYYKGGW